MKHETIAPDGSDQSNKTLFELSIDTRKLVDLFRSVAVGEVVSFKRMSEMLGRPVVGGTPNVQSAKRKVENENGIVLASVQSVGYKRLDDIGIVNTGEKERVAIRRKANRAGKRLTRVRDFDALPNDLKVKHNTELSLFGAIGAITKTGSVKKLEARVEQAQETLPLAKTLEAFKG